MIMNQHFGPLIPCLKEGESTYNFTPEELCALVRKAYSDGYLFAKDLYKELDSTTPTPVNKSSQIAKETNHGTN